MEWLKQQIEWFKGFFEDGDKKPSSKRFAMYVVLMVFSISYLKIAIPTQQLVDIPENWAMLIGGIILGVGYLSLKEKKKDG